MLCQWWCPYLMEGQVMEQRHHLFVQEREPGLPTVVANTAVIPVAHI